MKRSRRVALAMLALCILATSLLLTSGAAHAQTRAVLTPQHTQHTAVALDNSSYWFWAGWAGWGYCFSHDQTQAIGNNTSVGRTMLDGVTFALFGAWLGILATGIIESNASNWLSKDRGSGDCLAFGFGSPFFTVTWGR
jgi:hypothetical protein